MVTVRKHGNEPFHVAVVHGGPGAAGSLELLAKQLGGRRDVLEPIQTATTLNGQVEELRQTLQEHAAAPVILIGHSWGAWLSYIVSARYPALVQKLIMVGNGPFEAKFVAAIIDNRLKRLDEHEGAEYLRLLKALDTPGIPAAEAQLSRLGELAHKADTYDAVSVPARAPFTGLPHTPSEIYQGVWPEAARLRSTGELLELAAAIRCPVLAIHGDCDPTPTEGVRAPLAAHLLNFRMIVLNKCGHEPWLEKQATAEFYAILEREISGSLNADIGFQGERQF